MTEHLSAHFTRQEFENSQWAIRRGKDNIMIKEELVNARILCRNVLEPLRKHFDSPVIVTSGFRCEEVNKAIGGSPSSQHMIGEAADIQVIGHSAYEVADWLVEESNLEFDQVIYEFDSWVHVSYTRRYANRNQALTINKDGIHKGLIC